MLIPKPVCLHCLAGVIFLLLVAISTNVLAANVSIEPSINLVRQTVNVDAGSYLSYNFQLVSGTRLVANFKVRGGTNNTVRVWLLNLHNFQLFQAGQRFSYYKATAGAIRDIGKYSFVVPETNVYYLVIDNREALMLPRSVTLYVYGILPEASQESREAAAQLEQFYSGLKQGFIFQDFSLSIRHCGFENAFSNPNITLCRELIESLAEQGLENSTMFILFHELGHTLLRLWDYPLYDNEDVADEFATVFMILIKQQHYALSAAQWFANQRSKEEALSKLVVDDRHTISPQRARNIVRWLNNPSELQRRWQKIFVPNMQTIALSSMLNDSSVWIDHSLIRAELAKRDASSQGESGTVRDLSTTPPGK